MWRGSGGRCSRGGGEGTDQGRQSQVPGEGVDGEGAKASLPTKACCNRGLEREVFWKCSDGQAFRNKLLSGVSVPPPDCQLKFLGKRRPTKQEHQRPAWEARLERRRFSKKRGRGCYGPALARPHCRVGVEVGGGGIGQSWRAVVGGRINGVLQALVNPGARPLGCSLEVLILMWFSGQGPD